MRLAAGHLFVQHHAVKAFARRVGQQFFRERDVFLAGKAKTVNDRAQLVFRLLDALGNLHLLLARQQRHRAHLLEIHPHRVVQRVQLARFLLVVFRLLDAVHFRLVHDFNFQLAQLGENFIQLFRRGHASGSASLMSSKVSWPCSWASRTSSLIFSAISVARIRRRRRPPALPADAAR